MTSVDHIILGTGQATGTLLGRLIPTGDSIAVIEEHRVGGSCVNYGCTPTKTLVASARVAHRARDSERFGVDVGPVRINYDVVRERMNRVRDDARTGLVDWIENAENVTLIRGRGRFDDERTIAVGSERVQGAHIYLNVGTSPLAPPIDGLDSVPWLDSERLLELSAVPEHLIIIGGGYVGLEYAQVYRRFGAEVTVIQKADQLMPREDGDIADAIADILADEGITFLLGATARTVSRHEGKIHVSASTADGVSEIIGSHILVAAGRRPNSADLNLAAAGIAADQRGFIEVDDECRTSQAHVFALGDVNGRGAFTHTSVNDAEIALDALFGGKRKLSDRIPVYALFTDPPLGRVGLTEREALAEGYRVLKSIRPMSKIARAKEMGETKGFAKLLVDADTDRILGAAILGPGGDEVVNMFAAIMHSNVPCREYRRVVLVHPTISELMPWVLDGLEEVS